MNVTQEDLINDVAETEGIEVATVRRILKTTGNIIFDYLSSATPSEDVQVKVWSGITFNSEYIPAHTMEYGIQEGTHCPAKIRVTAHISRTYKDRINGKSK